jgi:hypothetical protein
MAALDLCVVVAFWQQLCPTLRLWILQMQLFDVLRLQGRHSNWILPTSLPPPQENGMIWSYSRLIELPQHWQTPRSRAYTIFLVVADT